MFGDLKSVAQDLLHYFDTRSGETNPHHNITSRSHYQEAIQFQAPENVIDQAHGLGSNHGPPDSQANTLAIDHQY